jgi:hypothetical protein
MTLITFVLTEIDKAAYNWGDYIPEDSTVIAAVSGSFYCLQAVLIAAWSGSFRQCMCNNY